LPVLEFSLTTWNCFGLPQGLLALLRAKGPPSAHRLQTSELREAMAGSEIVCFQELWLSHALRLFEELPQPHKTRDQSRIRLFPPTLVGAGLGLASRFLIVDTELRRFQRPHSGPDRLARKGMLHARLQLSDSPRVELDLVNTHLQAERGKASQLVRARQMRELAAFIEEKSSPARPFLLCGDLNINGLRERRADEYDALVRLLRGFQDLGAARDRPTFHPLTNLLARRFFEHEPEQRLDYIFYRPAEQVRLEPQAIEVALDAPLAASAFGPESFASDHYGLRARFRVERA
jgi:endonuclease/exonuclease/phosphatase family metal-dependent hydrolase